MNKPSTFLTLLGYGALACSTPALAQKNAPDQDKVLDQDNAVISLETLTINAQRREQASIDVPVSVRALSADEIRQREIDSTEEALNSIPNAQITRMRNSGTEWNISLRGIGDAAALNVDSSVAVYVDDVFVSDSSGFNFEFFDLDTLEVLRGPQGTLYGRNALGGAINIRLQDPGDETGGRVSAMYGSDNEVRVGASVDLPSDDRRLRTRISALYAGHDPRIENHYPGAKDADDLEAAGLRIKTDYDISDRTLLQLSLDHADTDRILATGAFDTVADKGVETFEATTSSLKKSGASVRLSHELDSMLFKSITAFHDTDGQSHGARPETILRNLADADVSSRSWTQEFQLSSDTDSDFSWTAGLFGMISSTDRVSSLDNLDTGASERSLSTTDTDSWAVYGEGRWQLSPRFAVALGGRYSADSKSLNYRHIGDLTPVFGAGFAPQQNIRLKRDFSAFSPQVTLEFRPDQQTMLYAKAGSGYKAGGFNTEFVTVDKIDFGKETLWNYEVGIRSGLFGGRGFLNAALFYADWRDQQALIFENFQSRVASAGKSRVQGAELELFIEPSPGLSLSTGLGYTDATFREFNNADLMGNNANGNQQPRVPALTGFASIEQQQALFDGIQGFYRMDYSYRDGFYWDSLNTLKEPELHMLDLSIGVRQKDWEVRLFMKNALDKEYNVQAFPGTPGLFAAQAAPGEARTLGLRVNYEF